MAELCTGGFQKWKNMLSSNLLAPIAFDRQNEEDEISTPIVICLKSFNGISNKTSNQEYQLRATLYDTSFKQFYGRTWKSSNIKLRSNSTKLACEQRIYLHTSLIDPSIAVVVELVSVAPPGLNTSSAGIHGNDDDAASSTAVGWTVMYPFKHQDLSDTTDTDSPKIQTLNIYNGSVRCLLQLEEPYDESDKLTQIANLTLSCSVQSHKDMQKVLHLIPENCLLSGHACIPGIAEGHRTNSKLPVDNLRKPRLLSTVECSVGRVEICMTPDCERFDAELLRLLADEKVKQCERSAPSGGTGGGGGGSNSNAAGPIRYDIVKRYLQIGVHNGLNYVSVPEVVQLNTEDNVSAGTSTPTGGSFRRRASVKRASLRRSSTVPSKMSNAKLIHRSKTHCEGVLEDTGFAIVFQIVYEIADSTNLKTNSMALSSFSVAVRWAAFCPLATLHEPRQRRLQLYGGPLQNADQQLVFTSGPQFSQDFSSSFSSLNSIGGGTISFNFNHSVPIKDAPTSMKFGDVVTSSSRLQKESLQQTSASNIQPSNQLNQINQQFSQSVPYNQLQPVTTSHEIVELPFTPQHIPIVPTLQPLNSGVGLPRSAYAALSSAGFPPILDNNGDPAEVLDPIDLCPAFEVNREQADRLAANEIVLQFLAFSTISGEEKPPSTIFFTFQFYRFPMVTTERLLLGRVQQELSSGQGHPCILQRLSKDGSILQAPPGLQVKYNVDPAFLMAGEGRLFLEHLSEHTLHLDVWQGDSLMLIGSCSVPLRRLCRQGMLGVQLTYELDVVYNDYASPPGGASGDYNTHMTSEVKGRLHLRIANVGHPSDGKSGSVAVKPNLVIESDVLYNKFTGGTLNEDINANLNTNQIKPAKYLADTSYELSSLLKSKSLMKPPTEIVKGSDYERKLNRINKVRSLSSNPEELVILQGHRKEKELRLRDLRTIDIFRNQNKNNCIMAMLSMAITTQHVLHASMGQSEFFEFVLRNPYNTDLTINIEISNPELKVITDCREWRHFKQLHNLYTPVEERMFNEKQGCQQLFMKPRETCRVPFKFLTMSSRQNTSRSKQDDPQRQSGRCGTVSKKESNFATKMIKVIFRTEKGHYPPTPSSKGNPPFSGGGVGGAGAGDAAPIAVLAVRIESQPHRVDQSFRFYSAEQTFLKRSIRYVNSSDSAECEGDLADNQAARQVFALCSEPNVIVTSQPARPDLPIDIDIKCSCGTSPQTKKFFVCIYSDPFFSRPVQIWQFIVHSLQQVDISTIEGQTSRTTLVLRGTQISRLVQCFSSNQQLMEIMPNKSFVLGANTIQEMQVGIRMKSKGVKHLYVNVVDVESRELLRSWMISVTCRPPQVNRVFEISVPSIGGRGSNKKVSYKNPYTIPKTFTITSSQPKLLMIRESILQLKPGDSGMIAMRFTPHTSSSNQEIFVYINDEQDKTEETFCVQVSYK